MQFLEKLSHPQTNLVISKYSEHSMSSNYDLKNLKMAILKFINKFLLFV